MDKGWQYFVITANNYKKVYFEGSKHSYRYLQNMPLKVIGAIQHITCASLPLAQGDCTDRLSQVANTARSELSVKCRMSQRSLVSCYKYES